MEPKKDPDLLLPREVASSNLEGCGLEASWLLCRFPGRLLLSSLCAFKAKLSQGNDSNSRVLKSGTQQASC